MCGNTVNNAGNSSATCSTTAVTSTMPNLGRLHSGGMDGVPSSGVSNEQSEC